MRKFFVAALSALAVISCSRDRIDPVGSDILEVKPAKIRIPLTIITSNPSDSETRTEMEGTTPYWSPGDGLGVTSLYPVEDIGGGELSAEFRTRSDDEFYFAEYYPFWTNITERALTAEFTGDVAIYPQEENAPETFYAYYPYPTEPEYPSRPDYDEPYYEEVDGTTVYYGLDGEPLESEAAYDAAWAEYERAYYAYEQAYEDYYRRLSPIYDNFLRDGVWVEGDDAFANVYVDNRQYPTLSSFDGTSDVLVSKPFDVTQETTTIQNLTFARMTSVLKLVLVDRTSDHMFTGEHPEYVGVLAFGEGGSGGDIGGEIDVRSSGSGYFPLAGPGFLDLKAAQLTPSEYHPYEGGDQDYYGVMADYSASHNFKVGTNAVYLLVFPQQLEAGTTLQIVLGESEHFKGVTRSIVLPSDIALNPGKMTTLDISLYGWDHDDMLIIAPQAIELDADELELEANGDPGLLTASILPEELGWYLDYDEWLNVQWSSSDESVVRIEKNEGSMSQSPYTVQARVIPVGEGTATITVSYAGLTTTCGVTVNPGSPLIQFSEDQAAIKAICVAKWDTSGDGELSESEAAKVTSIASGSSGPFYDKHGFTTFPQFAYFTGLTALPDYLFFGTDLVEAVIPENVETMGQRVFSSCYDLESVQFLGNRVTSIGNECFMYCNKLAEFEGPLATQDGRCLIVDGVLETFLPSGLTAYTIPASVHAFGNKPFYLLNSSSLSIALTLPDGIQAIPDQAFVNCEGLASITFGSGLVSIGDQAFDRCSKLSSVQIPATVKSIGSNAFYQCPISEITFPEGLETIGTRAFSYTNLREVILPSTVTSFSEAFRFCSNLTTFTVPANGSIEEIDSYAFSGCSNLSQVNLGSVITIGQSAFASCTALTSIDLGAVETISSYAFQGCTGLLSVRVPATVTSLGAYAFDGCRGLVSVEFLNDNLNTISNYLFRNCVSLSSVQLPASLTTIGMYAFQYCYALRELTIPSSVTSIGRFAFSSCGLRSLSIPEGVTTIEEGLCRDTYSYLTSVSIPSTVTQIKDNAFNNSYNLKTVVFASGSALMSIGNHAFYNCSALTSIDLPDGATTIGDYAFYSCTKLTSVHLPAALTTLGTYSFYSASKLTSLDIPDSVISIGDNCFKSCKGLVSVHIGSSVQSLGEGAFDNCSSMAEVNIPSSVLTIGKNCFNYCGNLTSIDIPGSVQTLSEKAFYNCHGLSSITLHEGLVTVGKECFKSSAPFTDLVIPASVTYIGMDAFWTYPSGNLQRVRMLGTTPPGYETGGQGPFMPKSSYTNDFVIEVPASALEAYQNHSFWGMGNWRNWLTPFE